MDDAAVSCLSSACIHRSMRSKLGFDSLFPGLGYIIRISCCHEVVFRHIRSCIWAWCPLLLIFLLQTRRASSKNRSIYRGCSVGDFLCSELSMGHHENFELSVDCSLANAFLSGRLPKCYCRSLCVAIPARQSRNGRLPEQAPETCSKIKTAKGSGPPREGQSDEGLEMERDLGDACRSQMLYDGCRSSRPSSRLLTHK